MHLKCKIIENEFVLFTPVWLRIFSPLDLAAAQAAMIANPCSTPPRVIVALQVADERHVGC